MTTTRRCDMNSDSPSSKTTSRVRVASLVILAAVLSALFGLARPHAAAADELGMITFTQAGRSNWEVPAGINAVTVEVRGAEGGRFGQFYDPNTNPGGSGGIVRASFQVFA